MPKLWSSENARALKTVLSEFAKIIFRFVESNYLVSFIGIFDHSQRKITF